MLKKLYKRIIPEKNRNQIHKSIRRLGYPLYLGNEYHCNLCEKEFRSFLPKGNIPREQAMCPYCFSLERTRVLDLYLENELDLYNQTNCSILHFAPEDALFHKLKKISGVEYIDADINPANARHVEDITNISYADDYFDYLICSHVLGHVPDENKAISECKRVLKPSGVALFLSVIPPTQQETLEYFEDLTAQQRLSMYGESDLIRLHGTDFLNRLATQFHVEAIDYRLQCSPEDQTKYSLGNGEREVIYKCTIT